MAQTSPAPTGDGADEDRETFPEFFESWLVEQKSHLEELVSTSHILQQKIEGVLAHYEQYYRAKSNSAHRGNAVTTFKPSWRSSLEDAFMWIGGWRPSAAFHLLYSKSGLQLEAKLNEILQGVNTTPLDLADLSQSQIERVDLLQKQTIREEKEVAEKLAKQLETVADSSMVAPSQAATEAVRGGEADEDEGGVEAAVVRKEEGMKEVLVEADGLRLKTLKKVIGVLSPMQAVHFLIAAAELHLRIHDWGKKRDAAAVRGG